MTASNLSAPQRCGTAGSASRRWTFLRSSHTAVLLITALPIARRRYGRRVVGWYCGVGGAGGSPVVFRPTWHCEARSGVDGMGRSRTRPSNCFFALWIDRLAPQTQNDRPTCLGRPRSVLRTLLPTYLRLVTDVSGQYICTVQMVVTCAQTHTIQEGNRKGCCNGVMEHNYKVPSASSLRSFLNKKHPAPAQTGKRY